MNCPLCQKLFSVESSLKRHFTLEHLRTDEEKEEWRSQVRAKWEKKDKAETSRINAERRRTFEIRNGRPFPSVAENVSKKYGVANRSQLPGHREKLKAFYNGLTQEERHEIDKKRRSTLFERFGIRTNFDQPGVREKCRRTHVEHGNWTPDNERGALARYRSAVYSHTSRSSKKVFSPEVLEKIGKCGEPGALQIDHRLTIKDGFALGVPPEAMAHPANLVIITWEENDRKKGRSTMTWEELKAKLTA